MISHFTKMALKAMARFKLHTVISQLSLIFGFICFISALLLSNYSRSFDSHFPNSDRIFSIVSKNVGNSPLPDNFPIVNQPTSRYMRSYFPDIPNIVRASTGGPEDGNKRSELRKSGVPGRELFTQPGWINHTRTTIRK